MNKKESPMKGAIAVFVKTPGLSPVKTRLASGIGLKAATEFYERSCQAVAAVCQDVLGSRESLKRVFWAVAEASATADPHWKAFPKLNQGEGGLGQRLDMICRQLQAAFDYVIFLGGDCPQFRPGDLCECIARLEAQPGYTLGMSCDGGFWLWGGSRMVRPGIWLNTPYSREDTGILLRSALLEDGPVAEMAVYRDIDTRDDLPLLTREMAGRHDLLPAQKDLLAWLQRNQNQKETEQPTDGKTLFQVRNSGEC